MRSIKFRVWSNWKNEGYITYAGTSGIAIDIEGGKPVRAVPPHDLEELENLIVEQFTGITDKNDREIFEGDIVKVLTGEPDEDEPKGYFDYELVEPIQNFYEPTPWGDFEDYEVVGNIHENPELLKQ
jgi:hypothetical protein